MSAAGRRGEGGNDDAIFTLPARKTNDRETRNGAARRREPVGTTHGAAVKRRVKISLDHLDRAGSPLCAYYVFIMAAYQESRDKTVGVSRGTPRFAPPRDSLGPRST